MTADPVLDPLRQSVSEALVLARSADENATAALRISKSNSDQLMGLAVSQQRTEKTLNEHKGKSEERHAEVLAAIEGAKANDTAQAGKLREIESKLTVGDGAKIGAGVSAVLLAVAGAITLVATQLAPVLPSVAQRYAAAPVVVTVTAMPSAAPAVSR